METIYQLDRDLIVIDVETTGTTQASSVIQLGAVIYTRKGELLEHTFNAYIKPYREEWTSKAEKCHGISKDFLDKKGLEVEKALKMFDDWYCVNKKKAKDYYIAQWSASFDSNRLEEAYMYSNIVYPFTYRTFDIASFVRLYLASSGRLKKNKVSLADCCEAFHVPIDRDKCHDALYDATLTAKLLKSLTDEIASNVVVKSYSQSFQSQ